jgi:hypothetical protein
MSKVVSATLVFSANDTFLPLPVVGTVISLVTVGNSTISNQLVTGLIIVRHIKSILELSLLLSVKGPMRSTHNPFQGVVTTSFGGICPKPFTGVLSHLLALRNTAWGSLRG